LPAFPSKLYFFGGYTDWSNDYFFGDLWEFDVLTNKFTFLAGSTTINAGGVYNGPDSRPDATDGGRAVAISNDTAVIAMGATKDFYYMNRVWLYHAPTARFLFIGKVHKLVIQLHHYLHIFFHFS
jgi:hypothetical protein